jgi:hypothetical protein
LSQTDRHHLLDEGIGLLRRSNPAPFGVENRGLTFYATAGTSRDLGEPRLELLSETASIEAIAAPRAFPELKGKATC